VPAAVKPDGRAPIRIVVRLIASCVVLLALLTAGIAQANTSHAGWPQITGMLLMNKLDQDRPLDGRPLTDPFDGTDPAYSCDGLHHATACIRGGLPFGPPSAVHAVPPDIGHNELLGGHGDDTIHAGPAGDVLWGDYKPSGQPTKQVDRLYGGPGRDFIYASHGTNLIYTGGGADVVHAHFGRGEIHCDSRQVLVYLSHRSRRLYRLFGCRRISYFTLGY
jgi:hypothetical protein